MHRTIFYTTLYNMHISLKVEKIVSEVFYKRQRSVESTSARRFTQFRNICHVLDFSSDFSCCAIGLYSLIPFLANMSQKMRKNCVLQVVIEIIKSPEWNNQPLIFKNPYFSYTKSTLIKSILQILSHSPLQLILSTFNIAHIKSVSSKNRPHRCTFGENNFPLISSRETLIYEKIFSLWKCVHFVHFDEDAETIVLLGRFIY